MTNKIDVCAIASLARLSFSEEETRALEADMQEIIDFVSRISSVASSSTATPTALRGTVNVLRDDVQKNSTDRDTLLRAAATAADGYITVPRVISEGADE